MEQQPQELDQEIQRDVQQSITPLLLSAVLSFLIFAGIFTVLFTLIRLPLFMQGGHFDTVSRGYACGSTKDQQEAGLEAQGWWHALGNALLSSIRDQTTIGAGSEHVAVSPTAKWVIGLQSVTTFLIAGAVLYFTLHASL